MYKLFYGLTKKPFQISSDPAFMWFGEKHKEALATLKYGVLDNKGFLLLTGDVGTGKTTLINALLQSLSDDIICASVPDPGLEKLDFFNYIAAAFGISQEFSTKGSFLAHFRKFLIHANENNKKVLLIIDEAQLLTQEMLEEIRLLSNIEKIDTKLINIFFIGQNEFNEILNREQNRAVRQRLTLNYNIDPLTPDETGEYIKHRLSISGASYSIFNESAKQEVFIYSGGFPRRINIICDHSLLSGYVNEIKIIDNNIVKESARELKIPACVKNRNINGFANYQRPVPIVNTQPKNFSSEKVEIKTNAKRFRFFMYGFFGLVFIFISWFYLFPYNFKVVVKNIDENIVGFMDNFSQIILKPSSLLTKKTFKNNDNIETIQGNSKSGESKSRKNEDLSAGKNSDEIMGSIATGIILPIQENSIKSDNGLQKNQSKSRDEIKKDENYLMIDQIYNKFFMSEEFADTDKIDLQKDRLPLPKEKIIIRFRYNTNDFTEEGFNKLVEFANILKTYPETKVIVVGYTDSGGNRKYNVKLSEFRANIVRSYLLGVGAGPDQIEAKGLGSINPIESNNTAWGRMMNRRVEVEIVQ